MPHQISVSQKKKPLEQRMNLGGKRIESELCFVS